MATRFLDSLKERLQQRRDDTLVHLMEYLNDPTYFKNPKMDQFGKMPKKNKVLDLATDLMERLFSSDMSFEDVSHDDNPDDPQIVEVTEPSIQQEIDDAINTISEATQKESTECSITKRQIKKEFDVFEESKQRTDNLNKLRNGLNSIQPTSVESERAFSVAGIE